MIMGKGRLSVFLVRITCANTDSGDAKNNTPTKQQINPGISEYESKTRKNKIYVLHKIVTYL